MHVKPRIFGLDAIRSLAIILVLISHTRPLLVNRIPAFEGVTAYGFFGVELFFVLSGFLIGGILIKTFEKVITLKSLHIFWIRRWFRTLPNYYLFLAVNIIIFFFFNSKNEFNWSQIPLYAVFLQNFAWNQSQFYSVSWSLCVEEWFYLMYPVLVIIIRLGFKITTKKSFLLATLLFILLPALYRFYLSVNTNLSFDDIRQIVLSRLDAMMTGVLIAILKFYYFPLYNKIRKPCFIAAIILITLACMHIYFGNTQNLWSKAIFPGVLTIGFALLLPLSDSLASGRRTFLIIAIEKISLWSYSLYLVNIPVRYVIIFLSKRYHINNITGTIILTSLFILTSFFISWFLFKYFESFFLKFRDKNYKQSSMTRKQPLSSDKLVNLTV